MLVAFQAGLEELVCNIRCENCFVRSAVRTDSTQAIQRNPAQAELRLDPADRMELDESKLTEDEVKALPRRSLNHPNQYCLSLWLR